MKVRLSVQHQKANVKTVVLHSNAVIGRSTECNLRLASGQVSRQHCQLLIDDQRVAIVDLGSSNGTFLNGQQLTANVETPLPSGAELEIGPVKFTVDYDDPNADTSIRKMPPEQIVVTPDMNTPPVNQMLLDQATESEADEEDEAAAEDAVAETEFADPKPPKGIRLLKLGKKPAPLQPIAPIPSDDAEEFPADLDAPAEEASTASAEDDEIDSDDERFNEATLSDVSEESLAENAADDNDGSETMYDTHAEFELDDEDETPHNADEASVEDEFAEEEGQQKKPAAPSDDDFMQFLQNLDE